MKIAREMANKTEKILQEWGTLMTLRQGEQARQAWGLLLPVRSKSRQYQEMSATFAGWIDKGFSQLYLSGKEKLPAVGEVVEACGRRYLVLRGESVEIQGQAVYQWAVLAGACQEEQP